MLILFIFAITIHGMARDLTDAEEATRYEKNYFKKVLVNQKRTIFFAEHEKS